MKFLSHGRLQSLTTKVFSPRWFGPLEIGAFVSVLVLGAGIWIGLEFEKAQTDRLEISEQEHLLTQSRVYQASIQHQLTEIRKNVLESSEVDLSLFGVRHWAQINIQETGTGPNPVIAFSEALQLPAEIQVAYVQFLKNKVSTLIETNATNARTQYAFLFPMTLEQFSEWVLVVFPPDASATVPKTKSEKPHWLAVLVDPAVTFSLFSSVASATETMTTRAFLISQSGYVITHSQKAYAGTNLSTSDFFLKGILPKFEANSQPETTFGNYLTIDRLPVQASVTRIDGFPLALVVEKVQGPTESRMESLKEASLLRSLGKILLLLGSVGAMAVGATWFLSLSRKRPIEETETDPDGNAFHDLILTAVIQPEQPAISAQPETSTSTVHFTPTALPTEVALPAPQSEPVTENETAPETNLPVHVSFAEANSLSREFEAETKDLRDSHVIMALLAEKTARILESPVLFLRYEPKRETLMLESRAGFNTPNPPSEINVPVTKEVQSQVLASIRVNQIPFFGEWRPLSKPVLDRLNIAHFEAWGLTLPVSDPERFEGNKKAFPFLGVLVILQPGVQSTLHQPSLFRMIRTAGVAHIANEIWSRNAQNQLPSQDPSRSELTRALWELPDDQDPSL